MNERVPEDDRGLQPGRLTSKVCVITGAASVLAEAVAARLAAEGATVVGIDREQHALGADPLRADLSDESQVKQVFAGIKRDFGRLDVLYNNAGLNDRDDHSALDMPLEVWQRVLAANLTTTFLCCKHGISRMLENDPPATVAFLASDDAGFITGSAFPLDGGISSAFTVPDSR